MRPASKVLISLAATLALPALAVQPSLELGSVIQAAERLRAGEYLWAPDLAPDGPVLLVVSLATQRAVIYRNGVPMLRATAGSGQSWMRLGLPGQEADPGTELRGRIHVPESFRRAVEAILQPGPTVVVTEDSLGSGGAGRAITVVEGEERP